MNHYELHERQRQLAAGRAIDAAAEELPEGFEIVIRIERGSGSVQLLGPNGVDMDDFAHAGDLSEQIHDAINFAHDMVPEADKAQGVG